MVLRSLFSEIALVIIIHAIIGHTPCNAEDLVYNNIISHMHVY